MASECRELPPQARLSACHRSPISPVCEIFFWRYVSPFHPSSCLTFPTSCAKIGAVSKCERTPGSAQRGRAMNRKDDVLVLLGAAVGGVLGYVAFFWIARQGFYGVMLPGGLLGLGAGIFKTRSRAVPVLCGLSALALGLFTEWRFAPFIADESLAYFLSHIHQLKLLTLLMIIVGTLIGFWVPFRRTQEARYVQ